MMDELIGIEFSLDGFDTNDKTILDTKYSAHINIIAKVLAF